VIFLLYLNDLEAEKLARISVKHVAESKLVQVLIIHLKFIIQKGADPMKRRALILGLTMSMALAVPALAETTNSTATGTTAAGTATNMGTVSSAGENSANFLGKTDGMNIMNGAGTSGNTGNTGLNSTSGLGSIGDTTNGYGTRLNLDNVGNEQLLRGIYEFDSNGTTGSVDLETNSRYGTNDGVGNSSGNTGNPGSMNRNSTMGNYGGGTYGAGTYGTYGARATTPGTGNGGDSNAANYGRGTYGAMNSTSSTGNNYRTTAAANNGTDWGWLGLLGLLGLAGMMNRGRREETNR
jgi:hypothetical protein